MVWNWIKADAKIAWARWDALMKTAAARIALAVYFLLWAFSSYFNPGQPLWLGHLVLFQSLFWFFMVKLAYEFREPVKA